MLLAVINSMRWGFDRFFSHRKQSSSKKRERQSDGLIVRSMQSSPRPPPSLTFPLVLGAVPCQDGSHDGFERQEEEILH